MTAQQILRLKLKAEVFKAMGQPTRLGIIELLRAGELTVRHIPVGLGADAPSISKHLSLLRNVNLVGDRKEGINRFYRLLVPQAAQYLQCMDGKTVRRLEHKTDGAALGKTG